MESNLTEQNTIENNSRVEEDFIVVEDLVKYSITYN